MTTLPNTVYSGDYCSGGHVQGIAVDKERGFVYYSFTTMLLKTDMNGNPIGSVVKLAGHMGCITYDAERNVVYGSLELKHDAIGAGIINRTGWDPSAEDSFYLVCFDCDLIDRMEMDAECDGVMRAVYLADVARDYSGIDEASGKKHRYGCSGIDGTGLGYAFGEIDKTQKKIMIAYGVYSDNEREDNDYQVILQFDRTVVDTYGKPLNQACPHHSGPETCEKRYFFYTGNTTYGVQNLEYDEHTSNWFLAVYAGKKSEFENFSMFFVDGSQAPKEEKLNGRGEEMGAVLVSAKLGKKGKQDGIYGSYFGYGSTGFASMGNGEFYISHEGTNVEKKSFYTNVKKYRYSPESELVFKIVEE